jgi:hypothetical protein
MGPRDGVGAGSLIWRRSRWDDMEKEHAKEWRKSRRLMQKSRGWRRSRRPMD